MELGRSTIVVAVAIVLVLSIVTSTPYQNKYSDFQSGHNLSESVIIHNPIIIDSEQDFVDQGWPGRGYASDPYLIENLNIGAEDESSITIGRVDVHFVIRNVTCSSSISIYDVGYPILITDCYAPHIRIEDCTGMITRCTLTNDQKGTGIDVSVCSDLSIINNECYDAYIGISIWNCEDITISGNYIHDCDKYGIVSYHSSNCIINSNILENDYIHIWGYTTSEYWHHEMSGNTIDGRLLGYYWNEHDVELDASQYDSMIVANCVNVTIRNAHFLEGGNGLLLSWCNDSIVEGCTFEGNQVSGLAIWDSFNCTIKNCIANNNSAAGISSNSRNTTIENCSTHNNDIGISIGSYNSSVRMSSAYDNHDLGIHVSGGHHTITDNSIVNSATGIELDSAWDCCVFNNTLTNCGFTIDSDSVKSWRHNISDNLVNQKEVLYLQNQSSLVLDGSGYAQAILTECSDIEIQGGTMSSASIGAQVAFSNRITLDGISMSMDRHAITAFESPNLTITDCNLVGRYWAVFMRYSSNYTIYGTSISESNSYGIYAHESVNGTIEKSTFSNIHGIGLYLGLGHYSIIRECTFLDCDEGIKFGLSNHAIIEDCVVDRTNYSISIYNTDNGTVRNNTLHGDISGIGIYWSSGISILNNRLQYCSIQIDEGSIQFHHPSYWNHNIVNNTIDDLPIMYYKNINDTTIDGRGASQIIIANCCRITLHSGEFSSPTSSITLAYSPNSTIRDVVCISNQQALFVTHSDYINVLNASISYSEDSGLNLQYSSNCTITDCHFLNDGIIIEGYKVEHWNHSISNCFLNGKPIGFFKGLHSTDLDASAYGQLILADCTGITVTGNIQNVSRGIQLTLCTDCTITLCEVQYCNLDGIYVKKSNDIQISYNAISHNNGNGIQLVSSTNCTVTENVVTYNVETGIYLQYSTSCKIYHNWILWNGVNAYEVNSMDGNLWDDDDSRGNAWSDWDGEGPYRVHQWGSYDRYPHLIDFTTQTTSVTSTTSTVPSTVTSTVTSTSSVVPSTSCETLTSTSPTPQPNGIQLTLLLGSAIIILEIVLIVYIIIKKRK